MSACKTSGGFAKPSDPVVCDAQAFERCPEPVISDERGPKSEIDDSRNRQFWLECVIVGNLAHGCLSKAMQAGYVRKK